MNQDSKMSFILLTTLLLALAADAEYLEADSPHHDKQMDKSNLLKVDLNKNWNMFSKYCLAYRPNSESGHVWRSGTGQRGGARKEVHWLII